MKNHEKWSSVTLTLYVYPMHSRLIGFFYLQGDMSFTGAHYDFTSKLYGCKEEQDYSKSHC
ncbi:hypothetical protein ACOME3_004869 [Neoechinorhynchus agilis]